MRGHGHRFHIVINKNGAFDLYGRNIVQRKRSLWSRIVAWLNTEVSL